MTNLKFALRQLLKHPGFTAVAVLTLALGIGANMVIFTLINGLLFKPLLARNPEQLTSLYQFERLPDGVPHWQWFSYLDFADLRADRAVFSDLAAVDEGTIGIREGDFTRVTAVRYVSANYFSLFGVSPAIGRTFESEEENSQTPVAILTYGFWRSMGADPGIIGQKIKLTRAQVTVIGVMPAGFSGDKLVTPAMFLPLGLRDALQSKPNREAVSVLGNRDQHWLSVVGRLESGLTLSAARQNMAVLSARFSRPDPSSNNPRTLVCEPLDRFDYHPTPSGFRSQAAPIAGMALGLSVFVLLAACLNLANMMLARGAARRREIALRMALGAARRRIVLQLLNDGLLLAGLGGATSLLLSAGAMMLFSRFAPADMSQTILRFGQLADWRLLTAVTMFSGLAAVLFALGPALRISRLDFNQELKGHEMDGVGSRPTGPRGARNALVIAQLAISFALLFGAGLFTRSALNAFQANPGFEFGNNFYLLIDTRLAGASAESVRQLERAINGRLAELSGVESVSPALCVPFGNPREVRSVWSGSTPTSTEDRRVNATYNVVGADYFRTLGIPMLRGRPFNGQEAETTAAAPVVIINQKLADDLWPGLNPIGRMLQINVGPPPNRVAAVVGVAASVDWNIFERERPAEIYEPTGQAYLDNWRILVRVKSGSDPVAVETLCRDAVRQVNPYVPLTEIQSLKSMHRGSGPMLLIRAGSWLFGALGAVAMLLSFLGVYSLKSYQVVQRYREIGIRISIGANVSDVVGMIVGESARLAALGLGVGGLLALVVGRLVHQFLYHVPEFDPITFISISVMLFALILFAAWLPARRAATVDPLQALRSE